MLDKNRTTGLFYITIASHNGGAHGVKGMRCRRFSVMGMAILAALLTSGDPTEARTKEKAVQQTFPIVELRQYTLHEGRRDVLIDLFEREFIEPQEGQGMKVIGTFT